MKPSLNVLMLEDRARDADLILETLTEDGVACNATRVETKQDFLDAVAGNTFDLILSDCSLPSFDGLSALKIAREQAPDTPFIFVSGTMGEEVAIETLKSGATDYVLKQRLSRLAPAVRRAITEAGERVARQTAESARLRAESLFRAMFDQMATGVIITDLRGRITRTNAAAQEMFGYDENEFCSLHLAQLVHTEDLAILREFNLELVCGKRPGYEVERRYLRRKGPLLWGRTFASLIRENNSPSCCVNLVQDISERKDLEQRFVEAQKMEVVGRLAAGIAHDFNNLLTVINGYSDLLLMRPSLEAPIQRDLEEIRGAGKRAVTLTQRLLTFSRQQVQHRAILDISPVIEELRHMLRSIAGEEIRINLMLDPEAGSIEADRTEIEQAAMNLVINARDAMPQGGEITISTECSVVDREMGTSLGVDPGSYVVLTLADTGHGMDEATKARIFEPFFTTKELGKGTGLGLWMVHEITRSGGGAIAVDSKVGIGTTIRIYLPRVAAHAETKSDHHEISAPGGNSETILLSEDDDAVREFIRQTLEGTGYRVLTARNGAEAVALSDGEQDEIDLLLTDFVMPTMRGPDLASHVTAARPGARVLYMSGYSGESLIPGSTPSTAWDVLIKPFTSRALLQQVRESLDRQRGNSQHGG